MLMPKPRIAILDDYQHLAMRSADWRAVQEQCDITVFDRHLGEEEAANALADFDILCTLRERMALPGSLLRRLSRLKFIAVTGPHHRTLDLATAARLGIVTSCTPRAQASEFATAELAWGLLLSLARHIPEETQRMRQGGWQHTVGKALSTRTLGLLGLGRLGRHMAPIARAFGMNVIAWSQNLTDDAAQAAGAIKVDKDDLFRQSDFVSLHLVLSDRTRHVVGARELALMKPGAYLVNTARGALIDGEALVDALRRNVIAGAALDTFDVEPLPDNAPLRTMSNVLLTPHLGYTVEETFQFFYRTTVENIASFLSGHPVRLLIA